MTRKILRHGYTTGTCAAAAAKGAALILREQRLVDEIDLILPTGELVVFPLHGQDLRADGASCYVVKDAGDDPDVTNGAEVHASIAVEFFTSHQIVVQGGEGIGRVTKPGLAVPVGEWAINPVPRRMILQGVKEVLAMRCMPVAFTITISIPDGRERAKKTLNERLGIVGGLSILGTTGIVKPISAKAWTDTIDASIDVARACGCGTVVLSTGRTSELVVQKRLALPDEAHVMMGDYVGHALRACRAKGVGEVILAGQFAKLLKIACGHEQTHVGSSELDLRSLAAWLEREPSLSHLAPLALRANTARQLLVESGDDPALMAMVCARARAFAEELAPGCGIKVLLAGYGGEVLYFA
jgi:cobalt-precorrin-5B (C1)-methyltransferase